MDTNADTTNAEAIQSVDVPTDSTEAESLQKLKENFRLVVDKLNEICKVNSAMLLKLKELSDDNAKLIEDNDKLYDELYDQKIELTSLDQYGRRENVEICNVPESITQEQLQKHTIEVLKTVNITVTGKDIHAVHRIGKKSNNRPRNVIVRFVNRKTAFTLLKNKKKLNNTPFKNYFVTENLCPYNKRIFNALYKRKKNKEIHSLWSYNGNVFVKVRESDDRAQVQHLDEIEELFSDDNDDDSSEDETESVVAAPVEPTESDDPANMRKDHGMVDRRRSFTISKSSKSHPRRRLSMVEEEVLRTPIPPMVISI